MKQHQRTSQLRLFQQQQRWHGLPAQTRQRVVHDLARLLEETYAARKDNSWQPPTKLPCNNSHTQEPTHVSP